MKKYLVICTLLFLITAVIVINCKEGGIDYSFKINNEINNQHINKQTKSIRSIFSSMLLKNKNLKQEHHTQGKQEQQNKNVILENKVLKEGDLTVGIIGSGMSGLYAAMILKDLGIKYTIYEGNKERIGGRIYTYHFPNQTDNHHYVDFGAMRFPKIPIMDRLLSPNLNYSLFNKLADAGYPINTTPYYMSSENNLIYYNGQCICTNKSELLINDPFHFGDSFNDGEGIPDHFAKQNYGVLLKNVFDIFANQLMNDFGDGFKTLLNSDHCSTREFLSEQANYPHSVINYLETLDSGTGLYDKAFLETVIDYFDFSCEEWIGIEGGSSTLVDSMVKYVGLENIEMGKMVSGISKVYNQYGEVSDLKIEFLNTNITNNGVAPTIFKHVISTTTLPALNRMDLKDLNLPYNQRFAIRSLSYDHSVKIAIDFKYRWWEDEHVMMGKPIFGGKSSTDLPIRTIVYPSHGIHIQNVSGVLIVSYTWSQDASRIGSLVGDDESEKKLIDMCLDNLSEIHNVSLSLLNQLYRNHKCWDWYNDDFASGAFALYAPSQFSTLFPSLIKSSPDGRFHISGEASSVHHGWVIGSLNSAYRSVDHILQKEGLDFLRFHLRENWGTIEEVEDSISDNIQSNKLQQQTTQQSPQSTDKNNFFKAHSIYYNFTDAGIRCAGNIGGFK